MAALSPVDGMAVAWLLAAWMGCGGVADRSRLCARAPVGNLMDSVSFCANASIYILAGLLAVLGAPRG
jgi:uncharacterized membrane protein